MTRTFIIAEAGVNHNGDLDLALRLVDAAVEAGADAVKFQTWRTELVVRPNTPLVAYQEDGETTDMFELERQLELPFKAFVTIAEHCRARGILFLSTAFDVPSLDFLVDELDLPILKVPSGEATNVPFLRAVARAARPVILSTGMCELDEVRLAVDTLRAVWDAQGVAPPLTLLHCTTAYPTPPDEVHLRSMTTLAEAFGLPVGLSDHSEGHTAAVAAVAMGATVVEKHFTLDRTLPGPDHQASLEPGALAELVAQVRLTERLLGSAEKTRRAIERDTVALVRRSLVATQDIAADTVITEDMLIPLRPEDGIPARDIDKVVGRPAWRGFRQGEVLTW